MSTDDKHQIDLLRIEIEALKARIAVLEARNLVLPRVIPPHVPAWWPYKGPTCAGRTITCTGITAHEAPPSDPSPACLSPTSGAGGGT